MDYGFCLFNFFLGDLSSAPIKKLQIQSMCYSTPSQFLNET